jgi:3-oxoacyl-[acyl-carrier-protein] synthase III
VDPDAQRHRARHVAGPHEGTTDLCEAAARAALEAAGIAPQSST